MSTMCIPKKICSSWRSPKLTRNWLWFSWFLGDPGTRPLAHELGCPLAVTVFPTCFFWCGRLPCSCLSSAGSAAPPKSQQWPGDWTHIQTDFHISTKAGTHHQHFQAICGFWFQIVRLQRSSRWLTHPFLQFSKPYFIGWSGIILGFPSNELAVPSSQSPNPMHGVSVANLEHVLSQFHGESQFHKGTKMAPWASFSSRMRAGSSDQSIWTRQVSSCFFEVHGIGHQRNGSVPPFDCLTQPFRVWLGGGIILLRSLLDSAI